jgi:hypothetical protein
MRSTRMKIENWSRQAQLGLTERRQVEFKLLSMNEGDDEMSSEQIMSQQHFFAGRDDFVGI